MQGGIKLAPRAVELRNCAEMLRPVEPRILQQNVQTAKKCASCGICERSGRGNHGPPASFLSCNSQARKVIRQRYGGRAARLDFRDGNVFNASCTKIGPCGISLFWAKLREMPRVRDNDAQVELSRSALKMRLLKRLRCTTRYEK